MRKFTSLAIAIAVAVAFCLTSCGNSTTTTDVANETAAVSETAELEESVVFDLVPVETTSGETSDSNADESSVQTSQSNSTSIVDSTLFSDVFLDLADDVGTMIYEDGLAYIEATGYEYDTSVGDDSTFTQITVDDTNGFQLIIYFIGEDEDDDTEEMTLLSYSNGMFECVCQIKM
ncbi:MAG: hypothetical protein LUD79_07530 [Oscillospiraceae bacterium]|nr:hypothetical protein [Oscillospiraceae bacterium]